MKIILCFLLLAGLVALISAAPDDKADAAKAAADKAKKETEDAAKKVKDAADAPAKEAKDIADDAKKAEKDAEKAEKDAEKAEKDAEKEVEKGAKDCVKPHKGKGHAGIFSAPIKAVETVAVGVEEAVANFFLAGLEAFGL